ncbi:hypothetical protein SPHV1_60015 [Novosphingobium sp. KN65.2]|nr:hypothetical protein SPHV1_60015 [Novosphingobium sp. KN65.2]
MQGTFCRVRCRRPIALFEWGLDTERGGTIVPSYRIAGARRTCRLVSLLDDPSCAAMLAQRACVARAHPYSSLS